MNAQELDPSREVLRHWLADRSAQQGTQRAISAFGDSWREGPVQARLDEAMAALPDRSAEGLAEAARRVFCDEAWVDGLGNVFASSSNAICEGKDDRR